MKQLLIIGLLVSTFFTLNAQESFNLTDFNSIKVSGNIEAELIPSSTNKVVITDYDGDFIEWSVKGSFFKIKTKSKWNSWSKKKRFKVQIYFTKELTSVGSSASAAIESSATLKGKQINIDASSGSQIELNCNYEFIDVDASSGASVNLAGTANRQSADVSSGATYEGFSLKCKKTQAEASSGASADVNASESLDASASSGGSIGYRGNPSQVSKNKSSGGSISKG